MTIPPDVPCSISKTCRKKRQASLASIICRLNVSTFVDATPGGHWGNQYNPIRGQCGDDILIWLHVAETDRNFEYENANAIDCFYGTRLEKRALQSCVLVKYTRMDAPMDELPRNYRTTRVTAEATINQPPDLYSSPESHRFCLATAIKETVNDPPDFNAFSES